MPRADLAGGGAGPFVKPTADAATLRSAAAKLRTAASQFSSSAGKIGQTGRQAIDAPWKGQGSSMFSTATGKVQGVVGTSGSAVGNAASVTSTYAGVVEQTDTAIDGLNRRYLHALSGAQTTAAKLPANSTTDPYAGVNSLYNSLKVQYDEQIQAFTRAASTFARNIDKAWNDTSLAGKLKDPLHPKRAAASLIANALGTTPAGLYFMFSGARGGKGLATQSAAYVKWMTNGLKSKVAGFFGKSRILNKMFGLRDMAALYSQASKENLDKFLGKSKELGKGSTWLLQKLGASEETLAKLGKGTKLLGRLAAPLAIPSGIIDMVTGGGYKGNRGLATRIMGGVGVAGGTLSTIAMFEGGAAMLGPVGIAIGGAALIGYGAYVLGNFVYDNRKKIGHALSTAWHDTAHVATHLAGDAWSGAKSAANDMKNAASDVGHAITHPGSVLKHIHLW